MGNFFSNLLGAAGSILPFIPGIGPTAKLIGAGIGALSSAAGASHAQNQADQLYNQQRGIAQNQQQLFGQASPIYLNLLQQLQQHAQDANLPNGQLPMSQQLLMNQTNQRIGQQYHNAADQLSFGLGRRGLAGSSVDAAARASLLANANGQRANFERQQVINQPQEYERRLGMLANSLNPGLGAGGMAAGIYGQQGANYQNQSANMGNSLGQSIQNFMMYNALHGAGGTTTGINGPYPGYTPNNGNPYNIGNNPNYWADIIPR